MTSNGSRSVDCVVVGAGFAGLYMLHRLRASGWSVQGFEGGGGVGGTWYWNRYPGARCDVESVEYSYSFDDELQQDWEWTERYAGQPEILRYLQHVADRYDLRPLIKFDTHVTEAAFDEDRATWTVATDAGDLITCHFVVMATGCLSSANMPDVAGLDSFEGDIFHTGRWPHQGVDFRGKRVAVIGTGSSGVQAIPIIAAEADSLVVLQRTPTYSVPARNGPLDPADVAAVKAEYAALRAQARTLAPGFGVRAKASEPSALTVDADERGREFEERWEGGGLHFLGAYADVLLSKDANDTVADFVRDKIRSVVRDPLVAERLTPSQVIGCKRLCLDTNYYETFNRPNVRLVDINESPIEAITATGIRAGGEDVDVDCIVFATGFDAMTGALNNIAVRGRGGMTLRKKWAEGPRTYLGLGVADFPNFFVITGPGSPSVLTNMVVSIEHHVDWIADCLEFLRSNGHDTIEPTDEVVEQWVTYVNMVGDLTLFPTCNSWYLGANIPGKKRVFMPLPGFPPYAAMCEGIAEAGYQGFEVDRPARVRTRT